MTYSALAVGLDRKTRKQFLARASSRDLTVECVAQATSATDLATRQRYELVACSYPLPDMVMREFGYAVRRPGSASRDAALLVLSLEEMQTEAGRGLPSGRVLVRSRRDRGAMLHEAIGHLLRVAPRSTLDVAVELSIKDGHPNQGGDARMINVSRSGMLLAHSAPPEVGHRCRFSFRIVPGSAPVTGVGEVVRHAREKHDGVHGFALRITDLLRDAEKQLFDFLDSQGDPGTSCPPATV